MAGQQADGKLHASITTPVLSQNYIPLLTPVCHILSLGYEYRYDITPHRCNMFDHTLFAIWPTPCCSQYNEVNDNWNLNIEQYLKCHYRIIYRAQTIMSRFRGVFFRDSNNIPIRITYFACVNLYVCRGQGI